MAPHSSTFAWKIPWTEEPGRLQSMGSLESDTTERLHFHFSLSCIGEGNGDPLQCSCLENPRDGGAWWAAIYGVTQSWTRLNRLSSSSSSSRVYRDLVPKSAQIVWEWKSLRAGFPHLQFCPVNQNPPVWPNSCIAGEIDLSFFKGGTLCQNLQNLETVMPGLSSLSLEVKKKNLGGEVRKEI